MVCGSRNGIVVGEFTNTVLCKTFDLLVQASNLIMIMIMIQVSNLIMMSLLPALVLTTFNYLIYKKISRFQMRPPILKSKNEHIFKKSFQREPDSQQNDQPASTGESTQLEKKRKVLFLKLICPRKGAHCTGLVFITAD